MRILVTGSSGKIGRELVKRLGGHELLLVDKRGCEAHVGGYICDLSHEPLEFISDFQPEVVYHLAASFERTDETAQFREINYADNIRATYRLNGVVASLKTPPKQYIYASSYLVYDPALYLADYPLKVSYRLAECDELSPRNLIGAAKLYGEAEVDFLGRNVHKAMKVTHARIFRVFGEGGQEFVSRLIEWKSMGMAADLWKPENRFDYIHTSDCAEALVKLQGHAGIYNVGTGYDTSIASIVEAVGIKTRRIVMPDRFEASCAETSLIEETTGWEAKVDVISWIKEKVK